MISKYIKTKIPEITINHSVIHKIVEAYQIFYLTR